MSSIEITVTYFGHSCVLVDCRHGSEAATRILLDPGNLTPPLENVGPLDAVFITHPHADHLDPAQLKRLSFENEGLRAFGGPGADAAAGPDVAVMELAAGKLSFGGVDVETIETTHETIYPGLPLPANLGYLVGGRLFAPGDSLELPPFTVDILLLPIGGPWMKLRDSIDFVRAVKPTVAIPIHDAGLTAAHRGLHRALLTQLAPEGTQVVPLDEGQSHTFD